jgi:His/Glu/Gln/Arg/opine family amino acid ABC transporter permease subunit
MGYAGQLLVGAGVTLVVALVALVVGTALGILGALAKLSRQRIIAWIAEFYTTVIRGVPDLITILIIYFGGTVALSKLLGRPIDVSEFWAGSTALGLVFGAYTTEIFRGAVQSVPKGQIEAAAALNLPAHIAFLKVTLPQAWRLALPAFGNQWIILLKQTSLISVVGLEELMRSSAIAAGATREPFTWYLAAAGLYLVLTGASTILLRYAEARANLGLARV